MAKERVSALAKQVGKTSKELIEWLNSNSDGRRHPMENGIAFFTLVAGLVSFAVGWIVHLHLLACAKDDGEL